jgi:5-methyltetrahydrofolate--homocysteine methyltransferase
MSSLVEALRSGRVVLMDGAMGTELQRAGLQPGESGESWNLVHPERVRAIHRSYVEAGAEVLLTNTFQADRQHLEAEGRADPFQELWTAAIDLARSVRPNEGWVLGDFGPFDLKSPLRDGRELVAFCAHLDGLLIETLSSLDRGPAFLHFSLDGLDPRIAYLLSFTFLRRSDGKIQTINGESPERCAWLAYRLGATAVGVNCGRDMGMTEVIEVIRRYRQRLADRMPLFARPNAGTPTRVGEQWVYPQSPEMMADRLPELMEAGVNMIGGCCGTTPLHIAAFKRVIDAWNAR